MALDETWDRRNVFTVARENRLYRDTEQLYWLGSDEGGSPAVASAAFTTAVGELLADGDLETGTTDTETSTTPILVTLAGYTLLDVWDASR